MFGWLKKTPLTTRELLESTSQARIHRSKTQIRITNVQVDFIIKKLTLWNKIKTFFTRNPVNTLFVRFIVSTNNKFNGENYKTVLVLPYMKDMMLKNLMDVPIQIYSTVPDLKYRFAYVLNKTNNLYLTNQTKSQLGIALSERPRMTNPDEIPQMDKHIYHSVMNIDRYKKLIA